MNCYQHPDAPVSAYCRTCGRPLCTACQQLYDGTVYCPEHAPATATQNPYAAPNPYTAPVADAVLPPSSHGSPGLAFILGLIPGVGAIYNAQYVKGLLHAIIFGLLISISNASDHTAGEPFLAMCCVAFYCYMPFEAFHTARKRRLGIPVDEWSSFIVPGGVSSRVPIAPILLIAVGILFLLQSLGLLNFAAIARFWPVVLIVIGAGMLYSRLRKRADVAERRAPLEATREQ